MNKLTGLSVKERTALLYNPLTKECYDGEKHFTATKIEINQWSITKSYTSKYVPIKCPEHRTLEEAHSDFVKQADKLKEQSNGLINLYKTGTLKRASLALFFYMANKNEYVPEELTDMEIEWLNNTNHGQLVYLEPAEGSPLDVKDMPLHSYDINAFYNSLMRDVHFKIPIKQGTFKTIESKDFNKLQFFQYGIYRVIIEQPRKVTLEPDMDEDDYEKYFHYRTCKKIFRFNKNNYYTSIDLNVAKKLKLNMSIIEDGTHNFLSYGSGTTLTGSQLFGFFVKDLYKLRTETKNKDFKLIMNLLWGSLCETNISHYQYDVTKGGINIDIDTKKYDILNQYFVRDNIFKIEYCKKNNYYKYPWARMKPFLLAFGRQKLGRVMMPYIDTVMTVNTDGFKTYREIDIQTGTGIGEVRYEGIALKENRFENKK